MRLTSKERILLYLLDVSKLDTSVEVPSDLTQEGVSHGSRIDLRHLPQYIQPLIDDGLVLERRAHVRGIRQRRKVYSLTDAGAIVAVRLRDKVKSEVVRVKDERGSRDTTVFQLLESLGGHIPVTKLVIQAMDNGTIDLSRLETRDKGRFVEMLEDAPRIEWFVGRRDELRTIGREEGRHRVFFIRGVAGIGKTCLAAKVCELERGKRNLFWHKVRSWDTPQTLFALIAEFLRALDRPGLEAVMKRGEIARAAQVLRDDLPGTDSLLVFDDVHEAARALSSFFGLLKDAVGEAGDVKMLLLTRRSVPFYDPRDAILTRIVKEIDLTGLKPEDVRALLGDREMSVAFAKAANRLQGHPLLLQLLRAADDSSQRSRLPRDVRRFLEEQIYRDLSREESTVMKTASLFRVPVPRESMLSNPKTTTEAFYSLLGRFLIRPVGEDFYELHDTVRDFFQGTVLPRERRELARFALHELHRLASTASDDSNFAVRVGYLSNALELSTDPQERVALWEELGDSNGALGDSIAAHVAYKLASEATNDVEIQARLHRKSAELYADHGNYELSLEALDIATRALQGTELAELGWIHLLRSRICFDFTDATWPSSASDDTRPTFAKAADHAAEALRIFENLEVRRGQALAHLSLGRLDCFLNPSSSLDNKHLKAAIALVATSGDQELAAKMHIALGSWPVTQFEYPETALAHLAALEAIPNALRDPRISRQFFLMRSQLETNMGDLVAAAQDNAEALRISRKTHDPLTAVEARVGLGILEFLGDRTDDARAELERAARECKGLGLAGKGADCLWLVADCSLRQYDIPGFREALSAMDDLRLPDAEEVPYGSMFVTSLALHGLDKLLDGDFVGCRESFDRAIQSHGEEFRNALDFGFAVVQMYYGVAIGVMGDDAESKRRIEQAMEPLRTFHFFGQLSYLPTWAGQIRETLLKSQHDLEKKVVTSARMR